jgi:hypothetical protein
MAGTRHSFHCDGLFGTVPDRTAPEEIARKYIEGAQRRISQPVSPGVLAAGDDGLLGSPLTPTSAKKKKTKSKERRKKSKQRGKGNSDDSVGTEGKGKGSEIAPPPLTTPVSQETPSKKKKRGKKFRYNSETLGVVIIPDCDGKNEDEKEVHDKSAHFSAVTEQTSLLDDDDFTAMTKDTKATIETKDTKEEKEKKPPKSPNVKKHKKLVKEKSMKSEEKRTKSDEKKLKRSSTKCTSNKETEKNASWGDDPKGEKTFMAPKLLSLLMDPAMQVDDLNTEIKPPSETSKPEYKRKSSLKGPQKLPTEGKPRRNSAGNAGLKTDLSSPPERPKTPRMRSKRFQEATNIDARNESWKTNPSPRRSSGTTYSQKLMNLYHSSKKIEKASPLLRRNLKSMNPNQFNESWKADPDRDNDIPSILFLSAENSHCNLERNESWMSRSDTPSSFRRKNSISSTLNSNGDEEVALRSNSAGPLGRRKSSFGEKTSSVARRKQSIHGEGTESADVTQATRASSAGPLRRRSQRKKSIKRTESWGSRERSKPLRKSKPKPSNKNESWGDEDPRNVSDKQPVLSAELVDMLGVSPSSRKAKLGYAAKNNKSPSGLKKTMSLNGLKNSPSINKIRNTLDAFKKSRSSSKEKLIKQPKPIPFL